MSKRQAEIDSEVVIKQYHEEFDRIYELSKIRDLYETVIDITTYPPLECLYKEWRYLPLWAKREVLTSIFTAKNENGEWVLKKGEEETLDFSKLSLAGKVLNKYVPKTFRDLFCKNCVPANDLEQDKKQIENLKLINW